MSPTIFTQIIARELPAHVLAEDARFIAFLDIMPLRVGHTLVVPKVEINDLFDQPDEILSAIMPFAQGVAARLRKAISCKRIALAVVGLDVPHAHLHLVPIDKAEDLDFGQSKEVMDDKTLAEIAAHIRAVD